MKYTILVSYTLYRIIKFLFPNLCPMEINFLGGFFLCCLVIVWLSSWRMMCLLLVYCRSNIQGLDLAVVLADPWPAPLKLSLADQPDLLPRRHGEALEQRSLDDEAIAILLLEGSDDIKVDCDDLRYGPTTPGGQAQLTASLFFCIPSSLFISRLVEWMRYVLFENLLASFLFPLGHLGMRHFLKGKGGRKCIVRIVIFRPSFLLSQFVSCAFREIVTTATDDLITWGLLGTHPRYGGLLGGLFLAVLGFSVHVYWVSKKCLANVATAALRALMRHTFGHPKSSEANFANNWSSLPTLTFWAR